MLLPNLGQLALTNTDGFYELTDAERQQLDDDDVNDPITMERPVHAMTFRVRLPDDGPNGTPRYKFFSPKALWMWVKENNSLPAREGPIWHEDWWALCNTYNPDHHNIPSWARSLKHRSEYVAERARERARVEQQAERQRARAAQEVEERREEREEAAGLAARAAGWAAARAAAVEALQEYEVAPDIADHAVQWAFFVKGHVPTNQAIRNATRAFFERHMRAEWAGDNPIENWGQRLGIQTYHGNATPRDMPAQTDMLAFTWFRFRLHLPEAVAPRFADWLTMTIGRWGYATAMDRVLGIRLAEQAGQAVAVMAGINDEDTEATVSIMNSQENARPDMTWQEYQEWLPFQHRSVPAAAVPAPPRQANWMMEEAVAEMRADDPIANFRPVGGANTDVTIRWRFWLKGPMSDVERSDTPMHWRRSFADLMREPGLGLPTLRTSQDPWFERLWVWIRAEEPRITGPRSGLQLSDGVVQRCEFALKLPADVASAWLTIVAQAFGSTSWNVLASTWFYVEPIRSTESSDKPRLASPGRWVMNSAAAPAMTEEEYDAWGTWQNIQQFRSLGAEE